jgi:tRNA 2-selenouridine synthase
MLIEGGTGTGKTAILHALEAHGAQTLDLEGIAAHRGSLFGATTQQQPAQKMFETRLAAALSRLDPEKVTYVEAESSKIGERMLPPSLWAAMGAAPRIQIRANLAARSLFLARAYADLTMDKGALGRTLDHLRPFHAGATIDGWHSLVRANAWQKLAAELISVHYDPRYAKSLVQKADALHDVQLDQLDDSTIALTALQIAATFG